MAAILSIASSDASAIVRYMVQGMTCAEVQELSIATALPFFIGKENRVSCSTTGS